MLDPAQRSSGPNAVPMTPVSMTNTAASEARPPSCSATSMAMGMVADFGARLISTGRLCAQRPGDRQRQNHAEHAADRQGDDDRPEQLLDA